MMITKIETERADLFDVSILISMRVHISGNVSEDTLKDAFQKAVAAHKILATRVCIQEDGTAFYESVGDDASEIKADNNKIFFEASPWMDILKREEKVRFKIEEGEYLKAFCYELSDEGCKILFLMHHLGGDGKSFVYFIESFMKALSGETLEQDEIRTIPAGDISDEALKDRIGPLALVPKIYNIRWDKETEARTFNYDDMDEAYQNYWADRESVVSEYIIKPETVKKIMKRCREWNVGFTAYVTTAFLRRLGRKLDIGYAVDARGDGNRCMGNQATGISIKYAYNYDKSFKSNVIKVQKRMTKKLEDEDSRMFILPFMAAFRPSLVDAINLEHAGTFHSRTSGRLASILGYGKKTKDLSITNLTKLDIADTYGAYKIDFFSFIPPVISYGKNIVGISTIGNNTVMTIHRIKKKQD